MDQPSFEIIDSHIHLWPSSEIDTLAWQKPDGPLYSQHSVAEYRQATQTTKTSTHRSQRLKCFIVVEADRKSHVRDESGWKYPLQEIEFLNRFWNEEFGFRELHSSSDSKLCISIVAWAPVPSGPLVLQKYWDEALSLTHDRGVHRICGFRYLVQDKPKGTMLQDGFIQSMIWMGRNGVAFDLGVDQRSGGLWQLDEAIEMIERVNEGATKHLDSRIIINHLCKPNMLKPIKNAKFDPSFADWQTRMRRLAAFPNTYMKLSGGFSESLPMPTAEAQAAMTFWERQELIENNIQHMKCWISVVLKLWGPERCMFGSDWPVCNVNGGGNANAWPSWKAIVKGCIGHLSTEEQQMIWAGTADKAYRLTEYNTARG